MEKDTYILNSYATYSYGDYLYYEIEFLDYYEGTQSVDLLHHGVYFQQEYSAMLEKKIRLKFCKHKEEGKLMLISLSDANEKYHFYNLINFEIEGFNIKFIYKKKKLKLG